MAGSISDPFAKTIFALTPPPARLSQALGVRAGLGGMKAGFALSLVEELEGEKPDRNAARSGN